ncbi:hypothetical protein MMC17_005226 [Xylographa soralifera]|nr:hypothetical protein [Xylographa soralifera]
MSVIKNEQSKILYEAFEKHRTDIAVQQQIITCLTYRFVLEHLPQKGTEIMSTLPGTNSSTGAWQKMWRLAVEAELDRMIVEYIDPNSPLLRSTAGAAIAPAAGATQATATAVTTLTAGATPNTLLASSTTGPITSTTPPSLRKLLQWDFDYWAKNNKGPLNSDKKNMTVPPGAVAGVAAVAAGVALTAAEAKAAKAATAAAAGAGGGGGGGARAGAGAARGRGGSSTTGRYVRVETYDPEYDTWPSFSYGNSLYSELSSSIHKYNRSYNIEEINFTESQRIILQWLSPDLERSTQDAEQDRAGERLGATRQPQWQAKRNNLIHAELFDIVDRQDWYAIEQRCEEDIKKLGELFIDSDPNSNAAIENWVQIIGDFRDRWVRQSKDRSTWEARSIIQKASDAGVDDQASLNKLTMLPKDATPIECDKAINTIKKENTLKKAQQKKTQQQADAALQAKKRLLQAEVEKLKNLLKPRGASEDFLAKLKAEVNEMTSLRKRRNNARTESSSWRNNV